MNEAEIVVEGMTCSGCAHGVRMALTRLEGVTVTDVDVRSGRVRLRLTGPQPSTDALRSVLVNAGYELGGTQ